MDPSNWVLATYVKLHIWLTFAPKRITSSIIFHKWLNRCKQDGLFTFLIRSATSQASSYQIAFTRLGGSSQNQTPHKKL